MNLFFFAVQFFIWKFLILIIKNERKKSNKCLSYSYMIFQITNHICISFEVSDFLVTWCQSWERVSFDAFIKIEVAMTLSFIKLTLCDFFQESLNRARKKSRKYMMFSQFERTMTDTSD